jgi:hypothetical protein
MAVMAAQRNKDRGHLRPALQARRQGALSLPAQGVGLSGTTWRICAAFAGMGVA